ncbi:hypothetical protein QWY31_16015 [Cytophagales bacterium LB-30]|uniref:SH3 domain-containing protein n=1 Tax=Shiella aurantiaca TaxID=3058365 RepID=A0ABT8F972_9BACT|nr:hypothetical protein [Shiella aurantiaca]MDN4167017.1 hypothetical protein [Shiella aurantiaca]
MSFKKSIFFSLLSFLFLLVAHSQSFSNSLQLADSLFAQRKYSKALDAYQSLYQEGRFTQAMLLKMAYLHERLNETEEALYYLSVYQAHHYDERVQQKVEKLAEANKLSGYEVTDEHLLFVRILENKIRIEILLVLMGILLAVSLVWSVRKGRLAGATASVVMVLWLSAVIVFHEKVVPTQEAIVEAPQAALMKGPSAAAGLSRLLEAGHKLNVKSLGPAWAEVQWNGEAVFIKTQYLRLL